MKPTTSNKNKTTKLKTTTTSNSTTPTRSTTTPTRASKTVKLKGRSSSSSKVPKGQSQITKFLELKIKDNGSCTDSKVLCSPKSDLKNTFEGKTTEGKLLTQVLSNTAEGREENSPFLKQMTQLAKK